MTYGFYTGVIQLLYMEVNVVYGLILTARESDVHRRQTLTTKVDPRTVGVKLFLTAVDP